VLVNLEGFFDGFLAQLERALADGLLLPANRALLTVVDRVADAVPAAIAWSAPPGLHIPQAAPAP
jgi:predicted Rossmann-fold nucleotide-binding protein